MQSATINCWNIFVDWTVRLLLMIFVVLVVLLNLVGSLTFFSVTVVTFFGPGCESRGVTLWFCHLKSSRTHGNSRKIPLFEHPGELFVDFISIWYSESAPLSIPVHKLMKNSIVLRASESEAQSLKLRRSNLPWSDSFKLESDEISLDLFWKSDCTVVKHEKLTTRFDFGLAWYPICWICERVWCVAVSSGLLASFCSSHGVTAFKMNHEKIVMISHSSINILTVAFNGMPEPKS